ncbi:MAG: aminopeptidase P family protein [Muribaculaceae bacterium]|nr:aminopeptidase P family protein [Muribaculaceae bacterium]
MSNTTRNNLEALRELMRRVKVSAVIIPGTDPHQSEYISDYWKFRDWVSGFTGSNGTAVVTLDDARLWTDSRYFLQAEEQLADSGFTMMRENGDDPDPTYLEWLLSELHDDAIIAIDGRLFTAMEANQLDRFCGENGFRLATEFYPADNIWTDRPPRPAAPAYVHDEALAGETVDSKLERVFDAIENAGADALFVTALDEIAWLLNLRGSDVEFTPVVIAMMLVQRDNCNLFIDKDKVTPEVADHLKKYHIRVRDYDDVQDYLERVSDRITMMLDPNKVSDALNSALGCTIVYGTSPIVGLKAVKNEVQIAGIRKAMERDGAALVRLMRWVEDTAPSGTINEVDVWERGKQERARMDNYRGDSFAMIAGYHEHGAIVHYEATDESASTLHGEGLLLVDSGAQYLDGTTDITRTITLGAPTESEIHDYTLVLKGHLALSRAVFPTGICGVNLDVLARLPLWQEGMTYWHGTGHGVGHFLGCHEGPQSIRTEINPAVLEPGMVVSNEPGLYKTGEYGIRTENLLLVTEAMKTDDFGSFLRFETLTLFPYDLRLIDRTMLNAVEIEQINAYHREVYNRIAPYLTDDERQWLQAKTQAI